MEVSHTGVHCVGSTVSITPDGFVASDVQHFLGIHEALVVEFCVESTVVDVSQHVEILGDILR